MLKKDWLELPEEVKIFVLENMQEITHELVVKFELSEGQEVFILDLEDDIILKKTQILNLATQLDKMSDAKNIDVRLLALDLAYKIFWPLQDFLGGVDKLILRLGGKVPRQKTLNIKKDSQDDGAFRGAEENSVRNMLDKYNNFKNLKLTANKIKNKDGHVTSPTVENWIEDYVHFLGAGEHDSLKRARYLSKSVNVLKSSNAEREKLRYFFVSYDENSLVFFRLDKGILIVEEYEEKKVTEVVEDIRIDTAKILDSFHENLMSLDKKILPANIIISEAENDINKVRDILWNSIGIGDNDKTVSCVKLLIEKRSFDKMIKDDSRFRNILKRFIGIKYGQNMEKSLDKNIDQLIARRIFLEMLLADKLGLKDEDLYVAAFYLTNLLPNSGQVIYLDKKDQKFKWRNIQVSANKFAWVDKI